jgi:hypothetical protein
MIANPEIRRGSVPVNTHSNRDRQRSASSCEFWAFTYASDYVREGEDPVQIARLDECIGDYALIEAVRRAGDWNEKNLHTTS